MIKRADGRWQQAVTVNINGTRKVKTFYGKTKAEVNRKMAEWKEDYQAMPSGKTFSALADEWEEYASRRLAWKTWTAYRPAMRRAVNYFGTRPASMITSADIVRYMRSFVEETHPAEKTAKNQLGVIRLILQWGKDNGDLELNPAKDINVADGLPKTKVGMPSSADIEIVKNSSDVEMGIFAIWAMYTGMRRGELLALDWSDVDLDNRTITVSKSLYYKNGPKLKRPKTAAGVRLVPILDVMLPYVQPGTGLVFPGDDMSYMAQSTFDRHWRHYKKITGVDFHPHQLRHAYATMLYEGNIRPEMAQVLLGHAQLSTTMDIYRDIRDSQAQKIRREVLSLDINSCQNRVNTQKTQ